VTARENSFSTSARPFVDLAHQHQDRLHHVQRFEAGDDHRLAVLLGKELVGLAADDGGDMRRADEAVQRQRAELAHLGRLEDVGDGRRRQHVVAQHAEVRFRPSAAACLMTSAVGGVVVSKPMAKNTTSRAGMVLRDLDRIGRRIDHAHVGAACLGLEQRQVAGGRHTQAVAVGAQDDLAVQRQADGQVDAADGQHTHRAARAVDHAHRGGSRSATP
jgi:hypothetical protein